MKFTIKKNKHFANFNLFSFRLFIKDQIKFKCTFDENCIYPHINKDTYDLNKLIGLSDNWSHMDDSVRIGWRCINGKDIELHLFCHVNGKMDSEYITTVNVNQEFSGQIFIIDNVYCADIMVNGKTYSRCLSRKSGWWFLRYMLKPYFGGNNKASNTMKIEIKLL